MSQEAELPRESVSSWDSNVRIYDAASPGPSMHSYTLKSAVLDVCWVDNTRVVSGGVDKAVKAFDLGSGAETLIGTHDKAVRCVEHSAETSSVITGSWDKTVRAWDPRTNKCHGVHSQPERVYTMSLSRDKLVVGTAQRHIWVYDLRNMAEPLQKRESSLKYQTRCVAGYPDGAGFAVGSVEGRVAMEYLDMAPEAQARKYAFKCHRTTQDGQDVVYPVNALAFHPIFGTFASGGCDGVVNVWDGANKKRLSQFSKYPTSIASLAFNSTGTSLAVASSYTFEQGAVEHPEDQIFIRPVSEAEVKPKPKGA